MRGKHGRRRASRQDAASILASMRKWWVGRQWHANEMGARVTGTGEISLVWSGWYRNHDGGSLVALVVYEDLRNGAVRLKSWTLANAPFQVASDTMVAHGDFDGVTVVPGAQSGDEVRTVFERTLEAALARDAGARASVRLLLTGV